MADVGRIVVSLVAVVAGCLGTAWLARRSKGMVRGGLRVVSRVQVSKASSLLVVSVGCRMLLVGAGEGGLRLISELDPADLEAPAAEEASGTSETRGTSGTSGTSGMSARPELPVAKPTGDLTPVALAPNALAPNALAPNALAPNALAPNALASTGGPWTGLIRHLQRMTLRTAPVGPSRVRKR